MDHDQIAAVFQGPRTLSTRLGLFWAASVGRGIDSRKEQSLLNDWKDSIQTALRLARRLGYTDSVHEFKAMARECQMWQDHVAEQAAKPALNRAAA